MGANNTKIDQDDELEDNTTESTSNSKLYHQQQHSQKKLLHKFQKKNVYGTSSAQSSSERIDQSDTSLSSLPNKTKKLLFKRKTSNHRRTQSELCNTTSSSLNDTSILSRNTIAIIDDVDPMTAAVERLSAQFMNDHEHLTTNKPTSSCSDDQRRLECGDIDDDQRFRLEKQNSFDSFGKKRDSLDNILCQKENENWLSTSPEVSLIQQQQKQEEQQERPDPPIRPRSDPDDLSSQDVVFDLFFGNSNESDRRKEKDRQQRMHYLLKRIWNGIYRAKLTQPETIVNWCCGIGVWDMEMALLFPDTKVIGIDFKGATLSNLQHGIPNLEFRHALIQNNFTGLESIESNSVDFVIMRDVWLINAPVQKWHNVLKESYRILKPGGWIEIAEHVLVIESKGPNLRILDGYFEKFFNKTQVDRRVCLKLAGFLKDSGFVEVDELCVAVPLGEWSHTSTLKEIGFLSLDLLDRRVRSLSKWLAALSHTEESTVLKVITEAFENEIDSCHSFLNWSSFTARKPPIVDSDTV